MGLLIYCTTYAETTSPYTDTEMRYYNRPHDCQDGLEHEFEDIQGCVAFVFIASAVLAMVIVFSWVVTHHQRFIFEA